MDGYIRKAKTKLWRGSELSFVFSELGARLNFAGKIEGNTEEGKKEREELEKGNMKIIEEVYKHLKEDEEVRKWIGKIKSMNGLR